MRNWSPGCAGKALAGGFQVPLWAIALLSAVAPALWLARAALRSRQTRRRQAGLCPACGYDLRVSPERCPECGAEARATTSQRAMTGH